MTMTFFNGTGNVGLEDNEYNYIFMSNHILLFFFLLSNILK